MARARDTVGPGIQAVGLKIELRVSRTYLDKDARRCRNMKT